MVIIIGAFLMSYQIFIRHKCNKACLLVINMVYTICFTSCKTISNLGHQGIRKYLEIPNTLQTYSLALSLCQYQHKTAEEEKLNFSHTPLFHMKSRICQKYFVHYRLCKQYFASNLPLATSNLICLTNLVTLRLLTQF